MEPSPKPHWLALMPLPLYALGQAVKAPMSTMPNSVSKVTHTSAVISRDEIDGLKWLEHGERIWARLWHYITAIPFSEVNTPLDAPIYRTCDCPKAPDLKPAGYDVAERKVLSLLTANQNQTGRIPLGNNEDVRQVGTIHIYQVLNLFLQMRYENKLFEPIQPNPGALNVVRLTFVTPTNPDGLTPAEAAETHGMFYPCWTTVVKQNLTSGYSNRASGFADRILLREPKAVMGVAGQTNVAFSELKNFWVYPTTSFERLLNGAPGVLDEEDGSVHTDDASARGDNKPTLNLLRQLWGQSHFLGSQIGFFSNLHGVMILLKDNTPGRSSFVLSSILPWTDPRLLTCLIGLSFIALDVDHWKVANPALSLLDMLAPNGQADPVLQRLPERRFVLPQRFHNAPLAERVAEQIQMAARAAAGAMEPDVPVADVPVPDVPGNVNDDDDEGGEEEEEEEGEGEIVVEEGEAEEAEEYN